MKRRHLFAYGTLKPGLAPGPVATIAARLRPLGVGRVRGVLYDLGPYPALVLDPEAESRVSGIVFALPGGDSVLEVLPGETGCTTQGGDATGDSVLEALDQYEGPWFRRKECEVVLESGGRLTCWVYEFRGNLRGAKVVLSGEWTGPQVETGRASGGPRKKGLS